MRHIVFEHRNQPLFVIGSELRKLANDKRVGDGSLCRLGQNSAQQPGNADAYCVRGLAYVEKGNPDQAITDYDRAIELNPKVGGFYYNRGLAYAKKGDRNRAIADWDQAITLDPDYPDVYYSRGRAYYHSGRFIRASADLSRALAFYKDPKMKRKAEELLGQLGTAPPARRSRIADALREVGRRLSHPGRRRDAPVRSRAGKTATALKVLGV